MREHVSAPVTFDVARRHAIDVRRRGGDVSAFVPTPRGATLLVADVSSKGLLGCHHAELVRETFLRFAARGCGPAEILGRLNHIVYPLPFGDDAFVFASAVVASVTTNERMIYASAGHECVLVFGERHHAHLQATGPVLGVFDDANYGEAEVRLHHGAFVVIATDGVLEARDPDDATHTFGTAGVSRAIARAPSAIPTAEDTLRACDVLCRGRYLDDATVVIVASPA